MENRAVPANPGSENRARWIVASNRLPFKYDAQSDELEPSPGGLVTAISGIQSQGKMIWVGVAPEGLDEEHWDRYLPTEEADREYIPVFVSRDDYDKYYNLMCNNVLWPLLHYEAHHVEFQRSGWEAYQRVSEAFAKAIAGVAQEGALVWLHDFHLFLVPEMLKRRSKNLRVGFFLHTPFPSSEVFRQLPVRSEILRSLLACDLVGFHDFSYLRHFCTSVGGILGADYSLLSIVHEGEVTELGVFPVSIDSKEFRLRSGTNEVRRCLRRLRSGCSGKYFILGVDRLDYIKGINLKLKAFRELLIQYPEMRGEVVLLQVAVPSRTDVPGYQQLRSEVERLVGEINGMFSKPNYVPVQYMFSSVSFPELLALYQLADVLLVTSRRDGMNLVAFEFLAVQSEHDPGVVVLSEFAGANSTLSHVIRTNPWDVEATAHNIYYGLTMPRRERVERQRVMRRYLEDYTATDWAVSFMSQLGQTRLPQGDEKTKMLTRTGDGTFDLGAVLEGYEGQDIVLLLDFDGTLVPIKRHPDEVILEEEAKKQLRTIVEDPRIEVVVVSGRDRRFLSRQLEGLRVSMAAEHGARFYDHYRNCWRTLVRGGKERWYSRVVQIMTEYSRRVPGSFVEKKVFCVAWHFRESPVDYGSYQARRLCQDLRSALASLPVTVSVGKKVVEVKPMEANKGYFANWYMDYSLTRHEKRFLIGIGDDETDEDMFSFIAERDDGVGVKVGRGETRARYRIINQEEVLLFLEALHGYVKSAAIEA